MCGIAAVLGPAPDGTSARRAAWDMGRALGHRGPDRVAVSALPGIALASARLAVTGPGPAGDQPMADPAGRHLLAFNGEIHNHRRLRAELPARAYRGDSDTETLLAALAEWGADALPRLEGPFAFVYTDGTTGKILAARDRFGVKPLYLARHAGRWYLSSEIKGLLAGGVPARERPGALRAVLANYWVNGPRTPLQDIWRVLPGTVLEFDTDGTLVSTRTWFAPQDLVSAEEAARLAALPHGDWLDELEVTLRAGVRNRLPQDTPAEAGVLCSGGLDSSLVLALAAAEGPSLPAYVASFTDQPDADETPWAARVARHTRSPLVPVEVSDEHWRAHFTSSVWHFEYPLVHQNSVALATLAARARADGLRVLFSGEGADELFGGYPSRHHTQRRAFGVGVSALEQPARRNHGLRAALGEETGLSEYEQGVLAELFDAFGHLPPGRRELAAALAGDLRLFLSHGLNRLDKNLMQGSIEVREPFLDTGVASFALNSPLERHLSPGLKAGLTAVARRHLPPETADREKYGFNFSVSRHLRRLESRQLECGVLREALGVPRHEWLEILATSEERSIFRIWSAEIWCRLFLEGTDLEAVDQAIWRE